MIHTQSRTGFWGIFTVMASKSTGCRPKIGGKRHTPRKVRSNASASTGPLLFDPTAVYHVKGIRYRVTLPSTPLLLLLHFKFLLAPFDRCRSQLTSRSIHPGHSSIHFQLTQVRWVRVWMGSEQRSPPNPTGLEWRNPWGGSHSQALMPRSRNQENCMLLPPRLCAIASLVQIHERGTRHNATAPPTDSLINTRLHGPGYNHTIPQSGVLRRFSQTLRAILLLRSCDVTSSRGSVAFIGRCSQ